MPPTSALTAAVASIYGHKMIDEEIHRVDAYIRKMIERTSRKHQIAFPMPSMSILMKRFTYDPDTGIVRHARGARKGRSAGSKEEGKYVRLEIKMGGQRYRLAAGRVAWALYHGEPPPVDMTVDHWDEDKSNNKIKNLRLLTPNSNCLRVPPHIRGLKTKAPRLCFKKQLAGRLAKRGSGAG